MSSFIKIGLIFTKKFSFDILLSEFEIEAIFPNHNLEFQSFFSKPFVKVFSFFGNLIIFICISFMRKTPYFHKFYKNPSLSIFIYSKNKSKEGGISPSFASINFLA